jgi:tetratricopeptide (TPR) repeat protein
MNTYRFLPFYIKKLTIPALIAIILCAFLATACTKSEDLAPAYYDKGVNLMQAEDYKGAIIEFRSALQLDPRLSKAHYQLALAYIEVKDAVNAYRELEMASQVDPNNIDAITKAAEMLFQGNEIHESRKRLNKVFAKDPNNVNALILAANMELQAKHLNEAESYIQRAYKLNPDLDRVYLAQANIHLAKKNYDKVRESIEKALEINPKNEAAYRALIIYWAVTNNLKEAEKTLQEMFEIFPDSPLPYLEMAKIQEIKNDLTGAATSLQKAIEIDPQDPELRVISARFYENHGQLQKAESSYFEAISVASKPIDYRAILADYYFNQKKYDRAQEQVEQVLSQYPEHMFANFVKTKLLLENDDSVNEAIALLEKLAVKNPQWSDVFFYMARAHFKLQDIDKAFKAIKKAVYQLPNNPDYRLLFAYILYTQKDYDQALAEAEISLKQMPNNYTAAILYGKSLYMTESYNQAIEFFKGLDTVKPNDFEILQYLGLSQLALEDYSNARQTLQKAVSLKKGHTLAFEGLLNILLIQNQKTSAISLMEDQIKADPLSPNLLLLNGTLLYNNNRLEDALVFFRKVQEIAPDMPAAYMMEALTLKALGRFEEEIALKYKDIAHKETVKPSSQMVLAALLEISGDIEGAKDAYRRVLQLSPDFPPAANNLAWILANDNNPDSLEEAMNLAQLAKEKQSSDPNIADTLGWVYYKKRQYYNAALQFQQAIEKSPTTPEFYYHLALALNEQNKKQDTINAVKKSLEIGNSFPERDQAESLYKKLTGRNFK